MKIKIPSSKGNIAAVINEPEDKADKLAILCPGYLDSKDYDHLKILAEDLASKGYTVVRFDPIGTWESDGNISDYTTTEYLRNVKEVLEYMFKQNNFKHILIGGHSRGGKISILYAAQDRRISIVLGIMPSTVISKKDKRSVSAKMLGVSVSYRDLPGDKKGKKEFRVPYSHFENELKNQDKYNVLKKIGRLEIPLILIAGERDKLVLSKSVKQMFKKSKGPKKFILIKGIGHDYRHNPSEVRLVNDQILKALKSYEKN